MGRYCLVEGRFVEAQVGEELHIQQFPNTFAVVRSDGVPVCIPHDGCTVEFLTVVPGLDKHRVLRHLQPGQTAHYQILSSGKRERDVVTLKTGAIVDLKDLMGCCTFQITEEQHP